MSTHHVCFLFSSLFLLFSLLSILFWVVFEVLLEFLFYFLCFPPSINILKSNVPSKLDQQKYILLRNDMDHRNIVLFNSSHWNLWTKALKG